MTRSYLWALFALFTLAHCARRPASNPRDMGGRPQTAARQSATESEAARRTEILFLGDNGHHRPAERLPELMAALGSKGINLTYTDRLEDLNPANLARFDGVLVYANWDSIAQPQERALLDFVAGGKGLIAVHCASWCFRNSAEYVKAVGGQFWRHKMDTIQTTQTRPEHPAVMGLPNFRVYDETYLHQKLQADNLVLSTREIKADQQADKPGQSTEPYTWVRNYGQGRVFYTAYGHDERTWTNAGFHQLMEQGILWAVGDRVKKLHDDLQPQPFAYNEAKLPNYERRAGPQLRQQPLSPEESVKHIQVPVDFKLEVFAQEPNVMHPIAMAWDERGRMYVLITKDYPNERKDEGGSDYILICEDTNGDGKADKFTRFAEGLSVPTGLAFYKGGLVVAQAPHLLYLKDTNGDDRADEKKILLSGFGTFDTHAGPSHLQYGYDNWIWGSVGYSGFKGKVQGDSLQFSQGFFRVLPDLDRPENTKLEFVTSTSNNTWGLAFNETGDVFGSTANNSHGWYLAIPHRYFPKAVDRPLGAVMNGSRSTDTHKDMKPITGKVRQVDVFGGFTSASGHSFYTARSFPKEYWNRVAFVCEPTGHIVHQNVMEKSGTDFEDKESLGGPGTNLLAGADEWVSPVAAQVGPDGAVWVADWYSFIIQHNPTPQGHKNGAGNAYETDLRDYTHGRLYRVSYKKAAPYQPLTLSPDRPDQLVAALKHPNLFWRMHAQRLLVERGQKDVVPALLSLLTDRSLDEIGNAPGALHALRTLEGLNTLDNPTVRNAVLEALKHPAPAVRKTVAQVLPPTADNAQALLTAGALNDSEPLVVLNSLLALTQMPLSPAVENAVLARLNARSDVSDRWLPDAFAAVLNSHDGKLMRAYLKQAPKAAATRSEVMDHSAHHAPAAATASTANTVPTTNSSLPDLVITGVRTEPASPNVRETARIQVTVTNQGGTALPSGTPLPINLRIEGQGRKVDLVSYTHNGGLKPGESVTIQRGNNGPWVGDLSVNFETAGPYTIAVSLDRENQIREANEQNNSFRHTLTYRAPQSLAAFALERASRAYASYAPVDSVMSLLRQAGQLDMAGSQAVVKGITEGWNPRRKVTLRPADQTLVADLSRSLPADSRDRLARLLPSWGLANLSEPTDPNTEIIRVRSVREAMQFDPKVLTVTAGRPVEIIFENPDAMQHNLVVGKPGTLAAIGTAADKLITAKDGAEKQYVPAVPQVLFATPLVNPDQSYRLKFTAPAQPGEYPFVCTFPGHWRIMNGVMRVQAPVASQGARK